MPGPPRPLRAVSSSNTGTGLSEQKQDSQRDWRHMPDLPASPSDAFQTPRQQLSQSREVHLLSGRLAGCSCAWAGAGHATTAPTPLGPAPSGVWGARLDIRTQCLATWPGGWTSTLRPEGKPGLAPRADGRSGQAPGNVSGSIFILRTSYSEGGAGETGCPWPQASGSSRGRRRWVLSVEWLLQRLPASGPSCSHLPTKGWPFQAQCFRT